MSGAYDELTMSRDEWLGFRRTHVGGSDVAAIMSLSPWRTPYQVWAEKSGLTVPEDISDRPRVEWGTRLERVVAQKFRDMHPDIGMWLQDPDETVAFVPPERPWAMATLDGIVSEGPGERAVLEIKTAHFPTARDWDDGVPAHYLAQVNHYLSVTGWGRAYVAVLIDGWDYREFTVERDDADVAAVTGAVDAFWHGFVETGTPPAVTSADSGALLDVHGEDDGEYLAGDALQFELVEEWREAMGRAKQARREADDRAVRLRQQIGDARGLEFPEGRLTWTRSESLRFDSAALKEADPETYELYRVPTRTQRMTWKDA